MARILITGAAGQVGQALQAHNKSHTLLTTDFLPTEAATEVLDITNEAAVTQMVDDFSPDLIINPAAYTAVDKAESEPEQARLINGDGVKILAACARKHQIPIVHYSTDYVFDGAGTQAFCEKDPTGPLGVYGQTKLLGEEHLRQSGVAHLIFRTSWVFSAYGHNFVKTMLRLGGEREELKIVGDQIGAPTSAGFLARMTLTALGDDPQTQIQARSGTYHLCCSGETSWHGFAQTIFEQAKSLGWSLAIKRLEAIPTSDYPTPARRPLNSRLNCEKFENTFSLGRDSWQSELTSVLKELASTRP